MSVENICSILSCQINHIVGLTSDFLSIDAHTKRHIICNKNVDI
jgi:DNA-binding Xre family transcriptional regulator